MSTDFTSTNGLPGVEEVAKVWFESAPEGCNYAAVSDAVKQRNWPRFEAIRALFVSAPPDVLDHPEVRESLGELWKKWQAAEARALDYKAERDAAWVLHDYEIKAGRECCPCGAAADRWREEAEAAEAAVPRIKAEALREAGAIIRGDVEIWLCETADRIEAGK